MFKDLETRRNIKIFFLVIGLVIISCVLLRISLTISWLPSEKHVITPLSQYSLEIIDKFAISLFVSVGVASCIYYLTKNDPNQEVIIVDPDDISGSLKKAYKDTDKWYFNGSSGSYTRSTTIPFLSTLVAKKHISINVNLLLMNPNNANICDRYATYRNSLDIDTKFRNKSRKSVQLDILATIISCYSFKTAQPRLNFRIGLKNNFSILRTDLGSQYSIITKEDPRHVGLSFRKDSVFYNAQQEEMNALFEQCTLLDLTSPFVCFEEISIQHLKDLLENIQLADELTDQDYENLIDLIKKPKNPYAN